MKAVPGGADLYDLQRFVTAQADIYDRALDEAVAYLEHPVLGRRLLTCTEAVIAVDSRSVTEIFPFPDDLKFRSSMTLYCQAAAPGAPFANALARYFHGEPDPMTIDLLQRPDAGAA